MLKKTPKSNHYIKNAKARLLYAATTFFGQKGFDGTSTREICKLADVNVSMIPYYFGNKQELYQQAVKSIVEKIIKHMKSKMGFEKALPDFEKMSKESKLLLLYKILDAIIDFFYSEEISDAELMLLYKEQMESGVKLNSEGYTIFKKLFASILGKDENDKEVTFRTITIIGQIHSARLLKQFSSRTMDQSGYSKADIQMLKQIITEQIALILKGIGA